MLASADTLDPGPGKGRHNEPITRTEGGALCNPFPMGERGYDEELRKEVCDAYRVWLRLRTVPASDVLPRSASASPIIQRNDGTPFDPRIAPRRAQARLTGADAVAAMRNVLTERRHGARVVRLVCSPHCANGELCHGYTLAEAARELIGESDLRAQQQQKQSDKRAQKTKPRKPRSDKGVKRGPCGPRRLSSASAHHIGRLSLLRFQHGIERQVSAKTREAMEAAAATGVEPWNAADNSDRDRDTAGSSDNDHSTIHNTAHNDNGDRTTNNVGNNEQSCIAIR